MQAVTSLQVQFGARYAAESMLAAEPGIILNRMPNNKVGGFQKDFLSAPLAAEVEKSWKSDNLGRAKTLLAPFWESFDLPKNLSR